MFVLGVNLFQLKSKIKTTAHLLLTAVYSHLFNYTGVCVSVHVVVFVYACPCVVIASSSEWYFPVTQ